MVKQKVLILSLYPFGTVGSQRFRFEQYLSFLNKNYLLDNYSFYSPDAFSILYKKGHIARKIWGIVMGCFKCFRWIYKLNQYDKVFIHREIIPIGPPFLEWIITRLFKKPIIYDFDDAIWLHDSTKKTNSIIAWARNPAKIIKICRWSHKISCGNSYLAKFALQYNKNVVINPTTIDTLGYHLPVHPNNNPLVIGWTGTHSTLPYLDEIIPILTALSSKHNFIFMVICDVKPAFDLPELQYVKWEKDQEIQILNAMDIGIMPLPDNDWSRGKCGFKLLQYMALEKASVASNVGVNKEIITHDLNGILCSTQTDWIDHLDGLLSDSNLRSRLGKNGRKTVQAKYSVNSNCVNFMRLFN